MTENNHNKNTINNSSCSNDFMDDITSFEKPDYNQWKTVAVDGLRGKPFEKLISKSIEDIEIKPIYNKKTLLQKTNLPGQIPYTRGSCSTSNSWNIGCKLDCLDIVEFNSLVKHSILSGQDELVLNTSQTKIDDFNDFKKVFNEIDLDKISLFIDTGTDCLPFLVYLEEYLSSVGLKLTDINGVVGFSIFSKLLIEGCLPRDSKKIFDEISAVIKWSDDNNTDLKNIIVSGVEYHNAGADVALEIALILSEVSIFLDEMVSRGVSPSVAVNSIAISTSVGSSFFVETSKLRVLRKLFFLMAKQLGATDEEAKTKIYAQTSWRVLSAVDLSTNIIRGASEVVSAAIGGADSIITAGYDNASGKKSSEFSLRVARNMQLVAKEECDFSKVIDPAGGSYYLEELTEQLSEKSWDIFVKIEKQGGLIESLKSGYIQTLLDNVSKRRQKDIYKRKRILVGVNAYLDTEYLGKKVNVSDVSDNTFSDSVFNRELTDSGKDIVSKVKLAVAARESIGAISTSLCGVENSVSDQPIKIEPLIFKRDAEDFETLQRLTNATCSFEVHLLSIGIWAVNKPRVDFSREYFQAANFKISNPIMIKDVNEAIAYVSSNAPKLVVLCAPDKMYPKIVPLLVEQIKKQSESIVVLAGNPGQNREVYEKAGVDEFIYIGSNAFEVLQRIQQKVNL